MPEEIAVPIPITSGEIAAVCEALRHQAQCRNTTDAEAVRYIKNTTKNALTHRRNEATRLHRLAKVLEARYQSGVVEAGRVERVLQD